MSKIKQSLDNNVYQRLNGHWNKIINWDQTIIETIVIQDQTVIGKKLSMIEIKQSSK